MAAAALACSVEHQPATRRPRTGRFVFTLADAGDDAEIRRLLRESVMPGDVRVALTREPSAAAAGAIEGDVHETIVARDGDGGPIAAIGSRSVRWAYLNRQQVRLGYLGQLRVDRSYRTGLGRRRLRELLDEGFAFCRALHDAGNARAYLMSFVAGNETTRRMLTGRRLPGWPRISPIGRFSTFAISLSRRPREQAVAGVRLSSGTFDSIAEIAACLQRNLRRYQCAPLWTSGDLLSPLRTRGLRPEDFIVATERGRVVGCAAIWDQQAFKQVVVRGYAPAIERWRHLSNFVSPWLGTPRLPAIGQALRFACLSHVAVDGDRADVLCALVAAAARRARIQGLDFLAVGFDDRHPFRESIARGFSHRVYPSELHLAYWDDEGEAVARAAAGGIPQPEVALL